MGHEEEQEGVGGVGRGRGRGGAGVSIPSGLGYGRQRGGSSGTLNAMCCKTCAVPLTVSYLLPVSTYIPKVEHGDGRSEEATLSPLGSTETWRFGGKEGTSCVREARGGDGTGAKRTFVGVAPSKSGTGESTSSSWLSWSTFEAAPQSVRDAQPTPRACPRTSRPRASIASPKLVTPLRLRSKTIPPGK